MALFSLNKPEKMHNMLESLFAIIAVLAVLQGLSVLLTHLETAAHRIEGRATWVARDGTVFEEFDVPELEGSRVMQHDFDESRSEALLARQFHVRSNG
jgi:hypothetical protein